MEGGIGGAKAAPAYLASLSGGLSPCVLELGE